MLCGVHGTDVQEAQFKAEVRKCALYWLHQSEIRNVGLMDMLVKRVFYFTLE